MRILFIGTLYPSSTEPTRGIYNRHHCEALRRLGHEVRVLAPIPAFPLDRLWRRSYPPPSETIGGILVQHPRFLYTPGLLIAHHYRMYRRGLRGVLAQVVTEFRPEAVILSFIYPDAVAMAPLCRQHQLPYAIFVLGSDFRVRGRQPAFQGMIRQALTEAPLLFCPGRRLQEDLVASGLPPAKVIAFANGVDHALFHARRPPPDEAVRRVLTVGTLVPVKGHDRLLAAWQLVRQQAPPEALPARLVLVGDGARRRDLARQAATLGLGDSVEFRGRLGPPAVADLMRTSHCLCLPSRSEGMPNVVLEALACGTPVVATDVGEVPFLVVPEVNGFTVPNRDETVVSDLAAALGRTLTRAWPADAISERMRDYTWEGAAETVATGLATLGR